MILEFTILPWWVDFAVWNQFRVLKNFENEYCGNGDSTKHADRKSGRYCEQILVYEFLLKLNSGVSKNFYFFKNSMKIHLLSTYHVQA